MIRRDRILQHVQGRNPNLNVVTFARNRTENIDIDTIGATASFQAIARVVRVVFVVFFSS